MYKKAPYVAVGAVVLVVIILLNLPGGVSVRLKHAVGSLFAPLFGITSSGKQLADKTVDALVPRSELLSRNESLSRENQELRVQLLQTDQITRENERLREMLGWQHLAPWRLRLANVVIREPANWWRTVQIDLGTRDGMRENLPVLTADGLVGRISSVSYAHSQVVLVGDPACKVSALVEDPAHDNGIVLGSAGALDSSVVTLSYLSHNAVINPGQGVITSGLGEIFPKGIPVGTVVSSYTADSDLYLEAHVKLSANLSSLEQVWVLLFADQMKSVNTILILITAFLAVFLQALLAGVREWIGTQINVLPALIVVAAFYGGGRAVALLSICGGLWFDSLSANPLGVSILPLFVVGQFIHMQRELILRDLMFAQFVLGLAASLVVPLLTLLLLFSMGQNPLTGWGTLWQLLVMAVTGGVLTPLCFRFFRRVRRMFFHQPMSQPSFREDREIRRGRF